jgi:hypothetical protein
MSDRAIESLQRILFREFLLERDLYLEAGLEDLPARLAAALGCGEDEAIDALVDSPTLERLPLDRLRELLAIRDMGLVSRTAASVAQELRDSGASYDHCIRLALTYGVAGKFGHVFSALRVAAGHNDRWARHHYLYSIVLGLQGNIERACWEANIALSTEPYPDGQLRIERVLGVLAGNCRK